MITDSTVSHLGIMRACTFHTFCFAERISIGNDILFWKVKHINRINCNSQEAGFEMKMRTCRTSGVTTQPDRFTSFYQLIFFNQLLRQVSIYSFQSIIVTNDYIFTVPSAFIFHNTYLTIKSRNNRITDINF